ncbi:hypothetical protein BDV36DRAFT_280048 [Aspergillus pseudocaelatus]|uniref:DUF6987 domain-containing protein n=1 Tax=Aspergillus pseudocaelatus TaxID=1825620 RepID=A0ABQ6WZ11_9EURO|nr:hypothetical protein BDV36DRAFT_280048 [Aspergillus pseudocaelatus]
MHLDIYVINWVARGSASRIPRAPSTRGAKARPQRGKIPKIGTGMAKKGEQRQQAIPGQQRASGSVGTPAPSEADDISTKSGGIAASPTQKASGSVPGGKTATKDFGWDAQEKGEKLKSAGEQAGEGLQEKVSEAPENLPTSLSDLEGLEVSDGGQILDQNGQAVGQVVEGDPADLVGMTVGADGEILDEDGDLVGRVDLLSAPEETAEEIAEGTAEEAAEEAAEESTADIGQAPSLEAAKGLPVTEDGRILNDDEQPVAKVVEGDLRKLVDKIPNEQGEIYDENGELLGRVEPLSMEEATGAIDEKMEGAEEQVGEKMEGAEEQVGEKIEGVKEQADEAAQMAEEKAGEGEAAIDEAGAAAAEQLPDISTLEGLTCNKFGSIVNADGVPVGELIEGDPRVLCRSGFQLDDQGQFWNNRGKVIGKAKPIPVEEIPPGPFADFDDLFVVEDGWVQDANGKRVGKIVDGDPKKLVGRAVDDDGDVVDKRGNLLGRAEPWEEPEEPPPEKVDLSMLEGYKINKYGNIMGSSGVPIARVVEGNLKTVAGRSVDQEGNIWGDSGEVIGRVEIIPENERETRGPFSGFRDLQVNDEGFIDDGDSVIVGKVIEGDPSTLRGLTVDEQGNIIDEYGDVKGRAERYEPPEEEVEEADLSSLEGKTVNKMGNVVDAQGTVFGRVASGYIKHMVGKKVDAQGRIWSDSGKVIGQAELIPDNEQEREEGPFFGLEGLVLTKDGMVVDPEQKIVGRLVEGDPQRLAGRAVDEDGELLDKAGNVIGRAEPWTPEEKQRDVNPMAGYKVNREGEVRDRDGNLIGKLTEGNLQQLIGKEIDDNGYVVDNDGNKIGECTLLENLPEEEPEPEPEPELSPEELERQEKEKQDRELAKRMCAILQQTLDSVQPICRQIMQNIEKAHQTPKDELDEEELVKTVKPLIEEAASMLQECKGALRALDPTGEVAATAKARDAAHEATPEQYSLANLLKELTQTVVETIEEGRRLIADMPHAKKHLNPLWALLSEPLFQIIAAVGLLLTGVLGLVSNLLDGLGLGGLIRGLLGSLGIDKILEGFGLGTLTDALGLGGSK